MPITFETVPDLGTNWVTILVYNALLDVNERTRDAYRATARQYESPKIASDFLKKNLDTTLNVWRTWPFPPTHRDSFQAITQGLLHTIIHNARWEDIYYNLVGTGLDLDPYEQAIHLYIQHYTWEDIIEQADKQGADTTKAIHWLEEQMVTWCTIPQMRQRTSGLNTCITTLLHEVWTHLDIPFLVEHLQEG
jgi:hypothetical protein